MMVACSNEDLTQQTQTKAGKMQFSATIAASSSGATTRTIYTEDTQNKKITVAWKVDDEIALVHDGVKDVATVKTINSDGSATITGYVTGATNNADVRLVYPAARVGTVTGGDDGTEYTADETVEGKLKTQDGTLAYIQDNLDFREDMGQLAVNGTEVTLAEKAAEISPLLAIWKLTLSDGTNNLSATQVKIKGGESVLASTTTLTAGTSVVTLAIPTDVAIDGALTIEATVGDDTYAYTKAEGVTFDSKYYQSTVTMAPQGYAANEYNEGSWDSTNKKVVFTKQTAASVTAVTNSASFVNWSDEWYTVSGNVSINGDVVLSTNVHLILQDGAKLTINGQLTCYGNKLYIYGQAEGDGKLNVTPPNENPSKAIVGDNGSLIEIHGGEITAAATGDGNIGLYTDYIEVYGGKLTATSGGSHGISFDNTFKVYGGEVVATSNATTSSSSCYGIISTGLPAQILTVYGGKVTATGNGVTDDPSYGSGIYCYVMSGTSGTSGIKFYFSDNGTTWGYGYGYSIAGLVGTDGDTKKRYAKAE